MPLIGCLTPNRDRIPELLGAIAQELAQRATQEAGTTDLPAAVQAAIWLDAPWPANLWPGQALGARSPFADASTMLAGPGWCLAFNAHTCDQFLAAVQTAFELDNDWVHLQMGFAHRIQFAAYDRFEVVMFGDQISPQRLQSWQDREWIETYRLLEPD
jgi:hypothetical protein